jgi:hypothetical protein
MLALQEKFARLGECIVNQTYRRDGGGPIPEKLP